MTDVFDKVQRSRVMSRIGGKNTKPEMALRRGLHALGFRYRLHAKNLSGKPDLVFPRYSAVCFVNGCFWHQHPGCHLATTPSTRHDFWQEKFAANRQRDERNHRLLLEDRWRVAVVWECQLKKHYLAETVISVAEWLNLNANDLIATNPAIIWTPPPDSHDTTA